MVTATAVVSSVINCFVCIIRIKNTNFRPHFVRDGVAINHRIAGEYCPIAG